MRWIAVSVGGSQAIGIVAPSAAAYGAFLRGAGKRARCPFPYIAGHIIEAEWRAAERKRADWSGARKSICRGSRTTIKTSGVHIRRERVSGEGVSPCVSIALWAACSIFSFIFAGQAHAVKLAKGFTIKR